MSSSYHKIDTVFKRDPATKHKTLLLGDWSQEAFGYLASNEWVFTEKVDGTNIRVVVGADRKITFGGKTDAASIPAVLVSRLEARFFPQAEQLAEMFPDGGCLYGEGYGPKIQKGGGNYRADADFVLFDVKVLNWWLQRDAVNDCANRLALDVVPVVGRGTLYEMVERGLRGFTSAWGNFQAEGLVARPLVELKTRSGNRIITKIKHKDFQHV